MSSDARLVMLPAWLQPPDLPGLRYLFWDADEPWPTDALLAEVELFVPPYMAPPDTWSIFERLTGLQVVQALMAGVDGIAPFVPEGVPLLRAVGVHDDSTAELAVGLMIASLRGIDQAARDMTVGRWRHERRRALADSRIGVVGWGGVGRAIAARLEPFETTVIGFSRSGADGASPVSQLDQQLPGLDVVVLALPMPSATPAKAFMDARRLRLMSDGALLVNVGRGGLVETEALVAELYAGRLRAALDVTDPEPLPPDHPLWLAPGCLITPHLGGDSEAFTPRARSMVARQLRRFASGQSLSG